jgi:hypothetical protein
MMINSLGTTLCAARLSKVRWRILGRLIVGTTAERGWLTTESVRLKG